jgi:hypothetical protein
MHLGPWEKFPSHEHAPAWSWHGPAARPRHVLAGGEVAGGEGPAKHDQQEGENTLGKVGLIWQKGNPANGGEGQRPWRRHAVPGEGPMNTGI